MALKYKIGDRVRIKSIDWYNENKASDDEIRCYPYWFGKEHSKYCGQIMTISDVREDSYDMIEDDGTDAWTDEMIEGLVEEETKNNNDMEEKETLLGWVKENDSLRLVPHKDYEIKHNGDNFYLVKKKNEYPKTYEECCKVIEVPFLKNYVAGYKNGLLDNFQKLLICRDAYWKAYDEEMGLEKLWEPDWTSFEGYPSIYMYRHQITLSVARDVHHCLVFPN